MTRTACLYLLVSPEDCDPPHGLDMQWEHDRSKVEMLVKAFREMVLIKRCQLW